MADMAQDRADSCRARIDIGVYIQRLHQRHQRGVIDQTERHWAADSFGAHCGQKVGLVVIGDTEHRIGPIDIRFRQKRLIQTIAI